MVKTFRYLTTKGSALEYAGVGISGSTLAALLYVLWLIFDANDIVTKLFVRVDMFVLQLLTMLFDPGIRATGQRHRSSITRY